MGDAEPKPTGVPPPPVRYSMRAAFKKCPRLVFYNVVAGVKPRRVTSNALMIGTSFHLGLETERRHGNVTEALAEAVTDLRLALEDAEREPDEIAIETARLEAYLTGYWLAHGDSSEGEWDCERMIELPGEQGTIDALWTDPNGCVWIVEDKTRTYLTDNLQYVLRMNEQLLSYTCLARQAGIPVVGCIYREAKKTTTRPKKGESIEAYCDRVKSIYSNDYKDKYVEEVISFSDHEIERYMRDKRFMNTAIVASVEQMKSIDQWGFNSESCNGKYGQCPYLQLCATGSDQIGQCYEPTLTAPTDGGFFRRQIWGFNPAKSDVN